MKSNSCYNLWTDSAMCLQDVDVTRSKVTSFAKHVFLSMFMSEDVAKMLDSTSRHGLCEFQSLRKPVTLALRNARRD